MSGAGPETTGCPRAPPTSSSLLSGPRAPSCGCWVLIWQKTPRGPPLLPQGPLHQLPEPSPSWAWGRLPQWEPRAAGYAQDTCRHGSGGGGQAPGLIPSVLGSSPGPHPQGPGPPAPPWPWTGAQPPWRPSRPALGPGPLSKRKRRLDSLEAAQGAPRDPRRDSRGERTGSKASEPPEGK